ncbi:MAG TPA: carbon storage regulator CsrA, partial [Candidatus Binatia bacterium]|nr:carbon storage regulator CsrA [Candidatus Binatia bacterium]
MLILSRHRDEKIQIGDDITITVTEIRGDKVRIGIEAPANVPVHRMEVIEAMKRREAAGLP